VPLTRAPLHCLPDGVSSPTCCPPPPLLLFLGAPSQPPPSSPFSPLLQRAESPHAPAFEFFYDSPHFAPTCQGVAASCPSTFCPSRWQPESFPPPEIEPECCRLPLLGETPPWVFLLKLKGPASSLSPPWTSRSSPHPPETTTGSSLMMKVIGPPFPHHLAGADMHR
jgi:hypothetical protein